MRTRRVSWAFALVILNAGLMAPAAAVAQTIRGVIVDESTGRQVTRARVSVLPSERDTVLSFVVVDNGSFEVALQAPGDYRLQVEALGYSTLTTAAVKLVRDAVVTLQVRLLADAIALQPLRVTAERVEPWFMRDIRYRQRTGFGKLVTREELDMRSGAPLSDVLATVPGVRISYNAGRAYPLVETRAAAAFFGTCYAALYLNGIRQFHNGGGSDNLEKVRDFFAYSPAEIEAIEVYRGAAEVPAEFSGSTAECGVVAIWLRTGASYAGSSNQVLQGRLPRVRLNVAASRTQLSGSHSPETGSVVHATAQWPVWHGLSVGPRLQYGRYQLTAETTAELSRGLGSITFRLPAGSRSMTLLAVGIEPRLVILQRSWIRPAFAGHMQFVRRMFQIDRVIPERRTSFWSSGWGLGGSAGLEVDLGSRLGIEGGIAHDWLSLGRYATLEALACNGIPTLGGCNGLLWDRTASEWTAVSFRLGIGYVFGR